MKRQIRCGVFETNSSMTHSLTICTEQEYNDWVEGKTLLDRWGEKDFIPVDEVPEDADEWDYVPYEDYNSDGYFEEYKKCFTTPNGDKIVAFGYYGYDG